MEKLNGRGRPRKVLSKRRRVDVRVTEDEYQIILDIMSRTNGQNSCSKVLRTALLYYYHTVFGEKKR